MKRLVCFALASLLLPGCASTPDRYTLAELRNVEPDLQEIPVGDSLDRALEGYRRFLAETPINGKTPDAMRRLADLQIERRYGIIGGAGGAAASAAGSAGPLTTAGGTPVEPAAAPVADGSALPVPEAVQRTRLEHAPAASRSEGGVIADHSEDQAKFEARAAGLQPLPAAPEGKASEDAEPRQAIATYRRILAEYPDYARNDQVLYQMARAHDELGEPDEAMAVMERLIAEHAGSEYGAEVFFRRAEYYFVRRKYLDAEEAYSAVIALGEHTDFFELALYKLGWSLYKQELYEDALHRYMALLDHKAALGYDFDRLPVPTSSDETTSEPGAAGAIDEEERRIADTFRVISLAFSNLGGPEVLNGYFRDNGNRRYENRIYSNLGEFYLTKLRYQDAASVYRSFTELNPFHRVAPAFSMRVVDIYEQGGFAQLVVESKQEYARRYALNAEYWMHFDAAEAPEVLAHLKANLSDLANHFHSLYQDEGFVDEQPEHYVQARHWYREYLASFPDDQEAPHIHFQLADLLFEHEDYRSAAEAYEKTAYGYAAHDRSAAAGYAAVFAHRRHLEEVTGPAAGEARLAAVESSLRFAGSFADHEQAATVLGAAADDLYDMGDFERAVASGAQLIDRYPEANPALRRSAWTVVAHASMDLERFAEAEAAYAEVLQLAGEDDEGRPALYDNLAAAIYKQGEAARAAQDHLAAAEHFLRIGSVAPTSSVRPAAEYDAATSLMKLESWDRAAAVFRGFREAHPDHELQDEVTKQLAFVYREAGNLSQAAAEYVRVADAAEDGELRRESLLAAGDLYADADEAPRSLEVFTRYVEEYPEPVDLALEIRFRMAGMHEAAGARDLYHEELRRIVAIDASAGVRRTARTRFLAATSGLVLAETDFEHFDSFALTLPFQSSLAEKQARMDAALRAFEALVAYGVADVTTAATYYMAEIYGRFGTALLASERPADLDSAERTEYELAIEAEAFPFEERAIEVHEKNIELMVAGTYDDWVRRSLNRLATLMPGRYAKAEISSGFIGPVEVFAYRAPGSEVELPDDTEVTRSPDGGKSGDETRTGSGGAIDVSALL